MLKKQSTAAYDASCEGPKCFKPQNIYQKKQPTRGAPFMSQHRWVRQFIYKNRQKKFGECCFILLHIELLLDPMNSIFEFLS